LLYLDLVRLFSPVLGPSKPGQRYSE